MEGKTCVDAATGKQVWRLRDGKRTQIVADRERAGLVGCAWVYGLADAAATAGTVERL